MKTSKIFSIAWILLQREEESCVIFLTWMVSREKALCVHTHQQPECVLWNGFYAATLPLASSLSSPLPCIHQTSQLLGGLSLYLTPVSGGKEKFPDALGLSSSYCSPPGPPPFLLITHNTCPSSWVGRYRYTPLTLVGSTLSFSQSPKTSSNRFQ